MDVILTILLLLIFNPLPTYWKPDFKGVVFNRLDKKKHRRVLMTVTLKATSPQQLFSHERKMSVKALLHEKTIQRNGVGPTGLQRAPSPPPSQANTFQWAKQGDFKVVATCFTDERRRQRVDGARGVPALPPQSVVLRSRRSV